MAVNPQELDALSRAPLHLAKGNGSSSSGPIKTHSLANVSAADAGDAEKADVHSLGGVTRLEWPTYGVRMIFDRLREDRQSTYAELTVAPLNGGAGSSAIISNLKMNLNGPTDRQKCISMLSKSRTDTPWPRLIEYAFRTVLAIFREGEPLIHLRADMELEQLTWLLNPIAYKDKTTVLYSLPDRLKSYLLLWWALVISTGQSVAGVSGQKGIPLYLDYEDGKDEHGRRLKAIQRAHPQLKDADVLYQRCTEPLANLGPHLQRRVAEEHVTAIFLDSLGMACGSDPQNPESAMRVFRTLRSLHCSAIIAAHVPKNSPEDSEPTIYGSVFHTALTRSAWLVQKQQETGEGISRIGLFNNKHNSDGGQRPIGFEVTFTPASDGQDMTRFTLFDIGEEPAFASRLPLKSNIHQVLKTGAKTAKQIAEELSAPLAQVRSRLTTGLNDWVVHVGKQGAEWLWGLKG